MTDPTVVLKWSHSSIRSFINSLNSWDHVRMFIIEDRVNLMILGYVDPGTGFTILGAGSGLWAFLLAALGFSLSFFKKFWNFLKKQKRFFIILLLIILTLIGFLSLGGLMQEKKSGFGHKIIILGFDGLSPRIVERMMREGKLPHFAQLKEQGSYSHLATTNPAQSPVAWSGFATGKNPGKHGVFDFIVRDPKNYRLSLSLADLEGGSPRPVLKERGFWWYSSQKKIPTVILGCPMTFPPDKIYGRMLSGMGVPDILGTEGTFSFFTTEPTPPEKSAAGKVFHVNRSPVMVMNFIGPRFAARDGKKENAKVPFKAVIKNDPPGAIIQYQDKKFELTAGRWSDWKDVTFEVGLFKKVRGIMKFYLVEASPEFKLYVSPINFDPRDPLFPISYPPQYARELVERLGLYYTQGMPLDTWAVNEKRLTEEPFIEQVNAAFEERNALFNFELNRLQRGLLYCYYGMPDTIQHMFWRYIDPLHPLYEENMPPEYGSMIEEWYKKMDAVLGNALRHIDQDDTLIVLSDHGFDTFRRAVHVNSWLKEQGFLVLNDPAALSGGPLLSDIDWSRTKAYAIGFGGIYINQKGRERDGIVNPGAETESLKTEIMEKLRSWNDEQYHQPVIHQVYKRQDIFWGDRADDTPDLFIGFNVGFEASWQTALGEVPRQLMENNLKKWSGSHLFAPDLIPGIILMNKKITKEAPSLYDIAPTILRMIGYSDQELKGLGFDGSPLFNDSAAQSNSRAE